MKKLSRLDGFFSTTLRFAVIGAVASIVHFGVASIGIAFDVPVMLANMIGFGTALIVSLAGHHKVSFPGRTSFWRGARRFVPAAVTGFIVNNLALLGLITATGPNYAWLKVAVAILIVPPVTFGYAYFFAYRAE